MFSLDENGNMNVSELRESISQDSTLGATNLFTNGDFEQGTVYNYWGGMSISTDQPRSGTYYATQSSYAGWTSGEKVPVDTSKQYKLSVWVKTIQRGSNGALSQGHIGFACYDEKDRFIDLRNCGDVGNTYLSRDLNPGDAYAYLQSDSGWVTGADVTSTTYYFRHLLLFPSDHPEYGQPHYYTRIGYGDYNIQYSSMTQTAQGDWELKLCATNNADITMPDIGYPLPAGTPVARGVAGGTYNYALGYPQYPEEWTNFQTPAFSGENRNSGYPFRYATKYVRFLILGNYAASSSSINPKPLFGLDDICFICVSDVQSNTYEPGIAIADDGVMHVQDIIEHDQPPVEGVIAYVDNATLHISNEFIES